MTVKSKTIVRYPWAKWFAKFQFKIKRGRHFNVAAYSMAQQVRNAANRYNVSVSIEIDGDTLTVKVD